ncbi:MAG: tetratricopeptide repeat protein [Pseudomonadota bacterium]
MSLFAELRRRNVIRVATVYAVGTWLVLQVGDITSGIFGLPDWTLRFLVFVAALGFPFALIFSWVYELTPEGIKRESEIDRSQSITTETGSRLNTVIIGMLVVTIGVLLVDRFLILPKRDSATSSAAAVETDRASIAVLPFDDFSEGEGSRYMANGLTETLTTMLTSVQNLRVAGQTSAFAFLGANKSSQEIGSELGVTFLLRGSVQRSEDKLRITANLIESSSDSTVWSKVFDKQSADIFEIQDEIANAVVARVAADVVSGGAILKPASIGTDNTGAYDLFLKAVEARRPDTFEALEAAEVLLKSALTLDPDFVEANMELSDLYLAQIWTGSRPQSDYGEALVLAKRAVDLRPQSPDAQMARIMAEVQLAFDPYDFETLERLRQETDALLERDDLSPRTRGYLAGYLAQFKRYDEAIEMIENSIAADPLNVQLHNSLGRLLRSQGRLTEAREAYRASIDVEEAQAHAWSALGKIDESQGDVVGFIKHYERAMEYDRLDPEVPGAIAFILYDLDLVEEAAPYLERVREMAPGSETERLLELYRAASLKDDALLNRLARQAIIDDVSNRNWFFEDAVFFFIQASQALGELDEALQFLNEELPDFDNPYRAGVNSKIAHAREVSEVYLLPTYSAEERATLVERFEAYNDEFGGEEVLWDDAVIRTLMVRDDIEGIKRMYRDTIFPKYSYRSPRDFQRAIFDTDFGQELLEDPYIRDNVEAWDIALERVRANTRKFLAER